jgi:hypothetical protein
MKAPHSKLWKLDPGACAELRRRRRRHAEMPPSAMCLDFGLADPEFRRALENSLRVT